MQNHGEAGCDSSQFNRLVADTFTFAFQLGDTIKKLNNFDLSFSRGKQKLSMVLDYIQNQDFCQSICSALEKRPEVHVHGAEMLEPPASDSVDRDCQSKGEDICGYETVWCDTVNLSAGLKYAKAVSDYVFRLERSDTQIAENMSDYDRKNDVTQQRADPDSHGSDNDNSIFGDHNAPTTQLSLLQENGEDDDAIFSLHEAVDSKSLTNSNAHFISDETAEPLEVTPLLTSGASDTGSVCLISVSDVVFPTESTETAREGINGCAAESTEIQTDAGASNNDYRKNQRLAKVFCWPENLTEDEEIVDLIGLHCLSVPCGDSNSQTESSAVDEVPTDDTDNREGGLLGHTSNSGSQFDLYQFGSTGIGEGISETVDDQEYASNATEAETDECLLERDKRVLSSRFQICAMNDRISSSFNSAVDRYPTISYPPDHPIITRMEEMSLAKIWELGGRPDCCKTYSFLDHLGSLEPGSKLTDTVVNLYCGLIADRSGKNGLPSVFAAPDSTLLSLKKEGLLGMRCLEINLDADVLLFPMFNGHHWYACVVDMRSHDVCGPEYRLVKSYDSCARFWDAFYEDEITEDLSLVTSLLSRKLEEENRPTVKWRCVIVNDAPQQENNVDCGVFTCKVMDYQATDEHPDFSQMHIPYHRHRIVRELIDNKLSRRLRCTKPNDITRSAAVNIWG